jgi:hypothetical protein
MSMHGDRYRSTAILVARIHANMYTLTTMTFSEWWAKHSAEYGNQAQFCRQNSVVPGNFKKAMDAKELGPAVAKELSAITGGAVSKESLIYPRPESWDRRKRIPAPVKRKTRARAA